MSALNNLNQLQVIENVLMNLNTFQLIVLVVGLVQFLLLHFVQERKRISSFFLGFQAAVRTHLVRTADGSRDEDVMKKKKKTNNKEFQPLIEKEKKSDMSLCRQDVEVVLKSLGLFQENVKLPDSLHSDDIFNLFEEKNPSLDEVKEAFEVFDENKDGFIDVKELQNILSALGLKEGSTVDNCRSMIMAVDENGDGRIDFDEFVKFMESSLC